MMRRSFVVFAAVLLLSLLVLVGTLAAGALPSAPDQINDTEKGFLPVILNEHKGGPVGPGATATPPPVPAPVIDSLVATPVQIEKGASATITWAVTGEVDRAVLSNVGEVTGQTQVTVSPQVTTTYTLTVVNKGGKDVGDVTVTVVVSPPQITSFIATPTQINKGTSSLLSWTVSGQVDNLSISPVVGNVTGQTQRSVAPQETTTYTLTATNSGGTDTAEVTVTVVTPPPVITSFTAPASPIEKGESAILKWSVTGAVDSLSISPTVGNVTGQTQTTVAPQTTTTYTLTATNAGGQATATATVSVRSDLINSFTATPQTINRGESTLLEWSVDPGVTSLRLMPVDTNVLGTNSITLAPAQTVEYALVAKDAAGTTVQQKLTVTVNVRPGAPAIESFVAAPAQPIAGQPTTLRWVISGANAGLTLTGTDGTNIAVEPWRTELSLTPTQASTTYTLTVVNGEGTDSAQTMVTQVQAADVEPLLVFDWNKPVTVQQRGFPWDQTPATGWTTAILANDDWTTPYDYANGTLYFRFEFRSQPERQTMQVQFCFWQNNPTAENCGRVQTLPAADQETVKQWNQKVQSMAKIKDDLLINWTKPRYRNGVAIKNNSGQPVSNYSICNPAWCGEDPDLWYPLDMRFTVYVVAKGDEANFNWDTYLPPTP